MLAFWCRSWEIEKRASVLEGCGSRIALCLFGLIHFLAVVQIQPALDDSIEYPQGVYRQNDEPEAYEVPDVHVGQEKTCCCPKHGEPEGSDLPAEMRLQVGARHVITFHIVHDDGDEPDDTTRNEAAYMA